MQVNKEQINEIISILKDNGIHDINELLKQQEDWTDKLQRNKGKYLSTVHNYKLWLANNERYGNKLRYNSFFDFIEYDGKMIQDQEENYMVEYAEEFFEHNINKQNLDIAYRNYSFDNSYNPVTSFLLGLKGKWDGTPRLETFIIDLLEADDNKINRFFSKTWMIGAVKRAFEPGCQFDNVLSLQGGVQGSGKSNLIKHLALKKFYHIFSAEEFKNKDAIDKMNKSWIVFLDEFDKFTEKEVADLKCKITETTMATRKSYAHNTTDYVVHWVYAAATNADDFLCDLTGDEYERRYWIIECHKSTVDSKVGDTMTFEYVSQLWAEAVHYYFEDPNQKLYLDSNNPLFEEYKAFQRKFKRTNNNTTVDFINEILNKKYLVDSKGCFKDSIDMYNQFVGSAMYENTLYINKVPCSYIRFILKKVYQIDCSPKTIKSMLMKDNKWYLAKNGRYLNSLIANVLRRTNPIENQQIDYSLDKI